MCTLSLQKAYCGHTSSTSVLHVFLSVCLCVAWKNTFTRGIYSFTRDNSVTRDNKTFSCECLEFPENFKTVTSDDYSCDNVKVQYFFSLLFCLFDKMNFCFELMVCYSLFFLRELEIKEHNSRVTFERKNLRK